jgi:hypothetical protein
MRIRYILLFVLGLSFLISACRPSPSTPFDALFEFPSTLEGADAALKNSVQVLAEEEVAGGLVILYSMPSKEAPSGEAGGNILARTFVTPEGRGWRAQASGSIGYSDSDDFVVAQTVGGNITDLTTAYGISDKGDNVRIEWSDGQIDIVPIADGVFLLSRPDTLAVRLVELLDSSGKVLESTEFD